MALAQYRSGDNLVEVTALLTSTYASGQAALAVELLWPDAFPERVVVSVCLINDPPPENCFWLKDWSENKNLANALIDAGLIEPEGTVCPTGFVLAPACRLTEKGRAVAKEMP